MAENMLKKSLIMVLCSVTLVAIATPIMLYLTYPVEEEEVIEHIIEKVYGNPPRELPRFIPGVVGYASPIDRRFRYRGTLILRDKESKFIVTDKGDYLHVTFLLEYRCINDSTSTVLSSETIVKNSCNKSVSLVGYFFRTPRGPVIVPIEVSFNGIRCIYLRR